MNTMNEEALKRELKAIDQQTETIIAAIFNAARREHITLGRLWQKPLFMTLCATL